MSSRLHPRDATDAGTDQWPDILEESSSDPRPVSTSCAEWARPIATLRDSDPSNLNYFGSSSKKFPIDKTTAKEKTVPSSIPKSSQSMDDEVSV